MRIAVIGGGVSGLVATQRLQQRHEVTLFEASDYCGGHANTVEVAVEGQRYALDTGFMVYNERTYPHFTKLLAELGVRSRPTTMGFSVSDPQSGLEYNGHTLNSLFAQRRNLWRPAFHRLLIDILRFNRQAVRQAAACEADITVADFLERFGYSQAFSEQYLLPMGAAIWSCPLGTFRQFPMQFIVEFYAHHGLLRLAGRPQWLVIEGGSRSYVEALLSRLRARVHLRTPVLAVRRLENRVELATQDGGRCSFDHVVFACHSDQALRILGSDATPVERELLSAFPYSRSVAVLHHDTSLLPRTRRAWASWNYRLTDNPAAPSIVTYNLNLLQGIRSRHTFCVTLNAEEEIDPTKVLRRFEYEHPVFTVRRAAAQARQPEVLGVNRTSFCGAYWRNGFHEDGVVSALAVAEALDRRSEASSPQRRKRKRKSQSPKHASYGASS